MAAASTESSKSIVTTTGERSAGSATKGVATSDASAQSYSAPDDSRVRASAQARPPLPRIHCSCSSSRNSVVSAGVFSVWLRRELSSAFFRLRNSGMYRSGCRDPLDPLDRGGRDDREPQAAVRAEVLLRREVVDVGLADLEVDAAGGARGVDHGQRAGVARARARSAPTHRSRSRCAATRTRRRPRPAPPSCACRRRRRARREPSATAPWRPRRTCRRTRRTRGSGCGSRSGRRPRHPRTPSIRRCRRSPRSPRECGRARARCERTSPTRFFTGAWRCDVPRSAAPRVTSASSCAPRTFEGPHPKRPSAGRRSLGITRWGIPRFYGFGRRATVSCDIAVTRLTRSAG